MKRLICLTLLALLLLVSCAPQTEEDAVQDTEEGVPGEPSVTEPAEETVEGPIAGTPEETGTPVTEETPAMEETETPVAEETPAEEETGTPAVEETPAEEETGTPSGEETPGAEAGEATVDVATSEELGGDYLVDGEGMSLYLFHADEQGGDTSACNDECAEAWPPFTTEGEATAASDALDASLLGTIEREDGTLQVTYNGWPLYYYAPDEQPGDTMGHDIEEFGAEWYLITPEGTELGAESESESG